ncbi:hypothetical protein FisN_11Lh234 [Fistulifera solaris]|uniref:Uncharacterized protein n=1 Tax=Fistulifera solaris TaxID=1519565 RepID=A0A1Z5J730_FISSO|nr:hypothetical protein FisN_11Lh234 [Fistulifera solaris]|eukprot:GAX09793.1 hypothetical protein FisN_11Lh234 [Fistulifera solaris]
MSLLASLTHATSTQQRRLDDTTVNNRGSFRIMMNPFYLVLAPTPEPLEEIELDDLFGVLSRVIETYFRTQLEDATLQYMFLRDMEGQYQNNQTTLSFPLGGLAQFSGLRNNLTPARLEEWTQYALEFLLPKVLQSGGAGSAPLSQVEFSVFLADRPNDEAIVLPEDDDDDDDDANDIIIIVISVAATLAVVAVVALLISRYYGPPTTKEAVSVLTAEARSPESTPPRGGDDRSEGSFTVHTEAGDSTILKTITDKAPIHYRPEEPTRVQVQKDMLASSWMDDLVLTASPPQLESVLAPSHFAASKEEQERRQKMQQQIEAEAWDDESEIMTDEVRFTSAHEGSNMESVSSF